MDHAHNDIGDDRVRQNVEDVQHEEGCRLKDADEADEDGPEEIDTQLRDTDEHC